MDFFALSVIFSFLYCISTIFQWIQSDKCQLHQAPWRKRGSREWSGGRLSLLADALSFLMVMVMPYQVFLCLSALLPVCLVSARFVFLFVGFCLLRPEFWSVITIDIHSIVYCPFVCFIQFSFIYFHSFVFSSLVNAFLISFLSNFS